VIVNAACSENSSLNNCVKPKSKDTGTQAHGKFVPTCHNCVKIGHIRPNCYLLRSHRPWIKQDDPRKSEIEDSSSSKYVLPHRRHIKGNANVICKNKVNFINPGLCIYEATPHFLFLFWLLVSDFSRVFAFSHPLLSFCALLSTFQVLFLVNFILFSFFFKLLE